jgi:uncharacterized membrane protein
MSASASAPARPVAAQRIPKTLALGVVLLVAAGFVLKYVFHYYLNYNPVGFEVWWPKRVWLLMHITGGMTALLIGPFQFSQRLRQRHLKLHRFMGRTYLIAIACAASAAFYLAATTAFGQAWGLALAGLATAWVTTSGMAFYAIKLRQIPVHREWMVRSYIVTFAFVTFRILEDYGPTSHLQPAAARGVTWVWASWALPLLAAEVIMQLRKMRGAAAARG